MDVSNRKKSTDAYGCLSNDSFLFLISFFNFDELFRLLSTDSTLDQKNASVCTQCGYYTLFVMNFSADRMQFAEQCSVEILLWPNFELA